MIYTKHRIEFDPDKCVGCRLCYKACFIDVIRWDELERKPVFKYMEDCEHCFVCQSVCKREAIRVCPDFASERLMQTFPQYR